METTLKLRIEVNFLSVTENIYKHGSDVGKKTRMLTIDTSQHWKSELGQQRMKKKRRSQELERRDKI